MVLQRAMGRAAWLAIVAMSMVAPVAGASDEAPGTGAHVFDPGVPPSAVRGLLYVRPFRLEEPYRYTFLRSQPSITRGFLLVLEVDPEAITPRQVDVPVLYAGDTPVHLINHGVISGRLVVIVPGWVDLTSAPLFFGSTELPERIDRAYGASDLRAARGRGARPFDPDVRDSAFATGGALLECQGAVELFRAVADLIDRYAPEERALAEIYRMPVVGE